MGAFPGESASTSRAQSRSSEAPDAVFDDRPSVEALAEINRLRAQDQRCGEQWMPAVGAVRWNPQAMRAAEAQARYLQRNNLFGHIGAQGSRVGQRLAEAGLRWRKAGENLAAGQDDWHEVLAHWLASPSHCRVLMTPEFDLAGLARVPGSEGNTYGSYWALVLAAPAIEASIGPLALSR
jgi:uncharacterized protein YkwD